jgi:hypothetical protein
LVSSSFVAGLWWAFPAIKKASVNARSGRTTPETSCFWTATNINLWISGPLSSPKRKIFQRTEKAPRPLLVSPPALIASKLNL